METDMKHTPHWLRFLYATSICVMVAVAGLAAAWPHGCCVGTNDCGDTKICCIRPIGWAKCYACWAEFCDAPNYCNYDNCVLVQ